MKDWKEIIKNLEEDAKNHSELHGLEWPGGQSKQNSFHASKYEKAN